VAAEDCMLASVYRGGDISGTPFEEYLQQVAAAEELGARRADIELLAVEMGIARACPVPECKLRPYEFLSAMLQERFGVVRPCLGLEDTVPADCGWYAEPPLTPPQSPTA